MSSHFLAHVASICQLKEAVQKAVLQLQASCHLYVLQMYVNLAAVLQLIRHDL